MHIIKSPDQINRDLISFQHDVYRTPERIQATKKAIQALPVGLREQFMERLEIILDSIEHGYTGPCDNATAFEFINMISKSPITILKMKNA